MENIHARHFGDATCHRSIDAKFPGGQIAGQKLFDLPQSEVRSQR